MKLHENQLRLVRHLVLFPVMDYQDCLDLLDDEGTGDRMKLSYVFRPLTKNGYIAKKPDGSVTVLAKGRALFPEDEPLISAGGGETERQRLMTVARVAAWMEKNGVPSAAQIPTAEEPCFIPSACWRRIAPGILSTTRFAGMLVGYDHHLAVYDIGSGAMEWQIRAEGSLFYRKYGNYETSATGMLLVCREDARDKAAENIIRQTMWHRRQLLKNSCCERNRPTRWSRSPIRLRKQYEHVYLTTPGLFANSLEYIWAEKDYIEALCDDHSCGDENARYNDPQSFDIELWPRRLFVNPATDLLKFVYFFAAVKGQIDLFKEENVYITPINYEIYIQPMDRAILRMYPELIESEGVAVYVYQSKADADAD